MTRTALLIALAAAFPLSSSAFAAGGVDKINGSITVAGGEHAGDVSTVNGGIRVEDGASVDKAETVNGGIHVGAHATANALKTVNGGIDLGESTRVAGTVETVNGGVRMARGADIAGHASNVNGGFFLTAAHIGGGIETVAGDIDIGAESHVEGGILVDRSSGHSTNSRKPRVVIGPHAVVDGTLEFRREVDLYVSDSATVGAIVGATATKFSGERP